jgi:hypothetical protein
MRRVVVIALLGVVGLLAATSLTLGALAVAGDEVGSVLRPRLDEGRDGPSVAPSTSDSTESEPGGTNGDDRWTPSASRSSEPTGSDAATNGFGTGDDDGSDSSGSGSDGSDSSGSGSDGSGSGDSGSGGSDDHDDD